MHLNPYTRSPKVGSGEFSARTVQILVDRSKEWRAWLQKVKRMGLTGVLGRSYFTSVMVFQAVRSVFKGLSGSDALKFTEDHLKHP